MPGTRPGMTNVGGLLYESWNVYLGRNVSFCTRQFSSSAT
jgi:hypothetical protein